MQAARTSAVFTEHTPDADLEKPVAIRAELWGKPGVLNISMMGVPKESKILSNKPFVAAGSSGGLSFAMQTTLAYFTATGSMGGNLFDNSLCPPTPNLKRL